jgi:hypothetical protein
VYLAVLSLDPTGSGRKRWTMRWKAALQLAGHELDLDTVTRFSLGRRRWSRSTRPT